MATARQTQEASPLPGRQAGGRRGGWPLLAVVVVGLFLRLLYLGEQAAQSPLFHVPLLDEAELAATARGLLAGQGFGAEPLFKAPGYALYLAGTMALAGDGWSWLARLLQHLAGAALAVPAALAARRLVTGARAGRVAALVAAGLIAFYPPLIRLEARLVPDFWVFFLQSLLVALLLTWPRPGWRVAVASGVAAALAWLFRPTLTPVLPLLAAWLAWPALRRRSWRALLPAGLFLVPVLLAMGGVALRNRLAGKEWLVFPWQAGYNFYQANRPGANGRYLVQPGMVADPAGGNPTRVLAWREASRAIAAAGQRPTFRAVDGHWFGRAKAAIRAEPAAWGGLLLKKALFLHQDRELYNFEDFRLQKALSPTLRFIPLSFGWALPFAVVAAALGPLGLRGLRRRRLLLLLGYWGGLGGAIGLYYACGRMRMPLWFPVAVLAAAAVAGMPTWLRAAGGRWRAAVALALGLGGAVVAWGDWWGVRSEDFRQVEYLRFSNAAFRLGRHAQALAWADQAAAVGPYPTLPGIRGQALYGLERYEDALASFQEAVRTVPGDAASAFNAAVILVQVKDDRAAALRFLDEALRRRPGHPQALALRQSLVPASPPPPPATAVHPHRQGDKHEAATAP